MTTHLGSNDAQGACLSAIRDGLKRGGVPDGEMEAEMTAFMTADGRHLIQGAAREFGHARGLASGRTTECSPGLFFHIQETVRLCVDCSILSKAILEEENRAPDLFEHQGAAPVPNRRRWGMTAVIGYFTGQVSERDIERFLAQPEFPFAGSGAWVRRAFVELRPRVDIAQSILFPDPQTSRWMSREHKEVQFPMLAPDGSGTWDRTFACVEAVWQPGRRWCLTLRPYTFDEALRKLQAAHPDFDVGRFKRLISEGEIRAHRGQGDEMLFDRVEIHRLTVGKKK